MLHKNTGIDGRAGEHPEYRLRRVRPIHPGEMLREDFLPDYALTVSGFADAIGVSGRQSTGFFENAEW